LLSLLLSKQPLLLKLLVDLAEFVEALVVEKVVTGLQNDLRDVLLARLAEIL
jgi:hypothetical protein